MARVTLGTGETITVGGVTEIFGTSGTQSVTIIDGSTITFRSGFNSGGDNIRLTGTASDFVMSYTGSNVTLFSAVDGITIVIPVGTSANNIVFDNGDSRPLSIVGGVPTLGGQAIPNSATSAPVALTAGPGTYTVSGSDGTEGDVVTFTVTRTDTTSAETLQYTVQGGTNGGTVPAAVPGADFTAAGNSVSFLAGQATATFTVALNVDNNVEGIEGYSVSVLSGANVVASTGALILDANNVGQTFTLTPGIDSVGTGSPLDLIGSEGSTSTVGQDNIVGTQADFNTFDNLNGGADVDTLTVLDNGAPFTFAPNFANTTIANIENLAYTSVRGFFAGALNTASWAGLEMANINIVGFANQSLTMGTGTSATVTQAGGGDLAVNGGGGTLTVNAASGDVNVGAVNTTNLFTTVNVNGGTDISVIDRGSQVLDTVNLNGFGDDASLTGGALSTVNITNLFGGPTYRNVTVSSGSTTTVNLTNVGVSDLDVTSTSGGAALIVNANGSNVSGLDDVTSAGNATVSNTGAGTLGLDDVAANGTARTVTLDAASGSISMDDVNGADVRNVNITGTGAVYLDSVTQSGNVGGTVITSTNGGDGVHIATQLGNNTQFEGSGNTGSDIVTFGATIRDNNFGGGSDLVTLNSPALGVGGSLDGGAGYDTLAMESNNAAAFTAGGPTATSNFEQLWLTSQALGTADVIDLANIGFTGFPGDNTTDVISNVGATPPVTEVATVSFAGVASWTDSVTFDGVTVNFADADGPAALAAAFVAQYGAGPNWTATLGANPGEVTLTSNTSGFVTDLTAGDFVFTDATTPGKPSLEQSSPVIVSDGEAPVTGVAEVWRLDLDTITLNPGESLSINEIEPVPGTPDFTYTNGLAFPIDQDGGELADAIVAAANADGDFSARWTAVRDGNDVVFTRNATGASNGLEFSAPLGGGDIASLSVVTEGVTAVSGDDEDVYFLLDGTASGNDQLIFDGVTITFNDGDTAGAMAAAFIAQYNAAPGRTYNASAPNFLEPYWPLPGAIELESITLDNLPDVTAGDLVFVDDNNVGTPSVTVATTTQGSTSSVTLNNFTSGSDLTLTAPLGTHIVNLVANTASDSMVLNLNNGGDHGTVTANQVENVTINTGGGSGVDVLDLMDTSLQTLVVTGGSNDGLTLETNSTQISSIDASGLGGLFTWSADANTVPITVSTGSGGSNVDFSAMTIQGLAPITFLGGAGSDNVTLGGTGTSRATITTGGGFDNVNVDVVDGGNDYSSITDFNPNFDTLTFIQPIGAEANAPDQVLEPTAIFQDYLDQAADGAGNGDVRYFYWQGDTYVVQDNGAGEDFQDGVDTVIRLEGIIDLDAANFA